MIPDNKNEVIHFVYCPFTGLGLYNGFRGSRWLKNRIKIFKQFVVPSLKAQSDQDFILWISWRYEEKNNNLVEEFETDLLETGLRVKFTYGGCMFWDDKYPDNEAKERLVHSIHDNIGELLDIIGEARKIYWTLQPSDDCYHRKTIEAVKKVFKNPLIQAFGFKKGYVMDYKTGKLAEWNPTTNPPFFSICFSRNEFIDPLEHLKFTGPYKSHEYVGDYLRYVSIDQRGFIVGTHGENISTVFDHPFRGRIFNEKETKNILEDFGLGKSEYLELPYSLRKKIFNKFPYKIQRRLRYWAGEKQWIMRPLFSFIYNTLRK